MSAHNPNTPDPTPAPAPIPAPTPDPATEREPDSIADSAATNTPASSPLQDPQGRPCPAAPSRRYPAIRPACTDPGFVVPGAKTSLQAANRLLGVLVCDQNIDLPNATAQDIISLLAGELEQAEELGLSGSSGGGPAMMMTPFGPAISMFLPKDPGEGGDGNKLSPLVPRAMLNALAQERDMYLATVDRLLEKYHAVRMELARLQGGDAAAPTSDQPPEGGLDAHS
ncbi:MAG: hypothetical protein O2855_09130 [Planctomycetota bacterium]|nr:hypothetical protein [Planctomycetota bacterium]